MHHWLGRLWRRCWRGGGSSWWARQLVAWQRTQHHLLHHHLMHLHILHHHHLNKIWKKENHCSSFKVKYLNYRIATSLTVTGNHAERSRNFAGFCLILTLGQSGSQHQLDGNIGERPLPQCHYYHF